MSSAEQASVRRPRFGLTLTSRLLLAGFLMTLLVVTAISSYLLLSRSSQAEGAALSNAANRSLITSKLLQAVVASPSYSAAQRLASQTALVTALQDSEPQTAVPALLGSAQLSLISDASVVVIAHQAAGDHVVYTTECPVGSGPPSQTAVQVTGCENDTAVPHLAPGLDSVSLAEKQTAGGKPIEGVEFLQSGDAQPAYDVAVPVIGDGKVVGVVVYTTPLINAFSRYQPVIGYVPSVIARSRPNMILRISGTEFVAQTAPSVISQAIAVDNSATNSASTARSIYGSAAGSTAGSFSELPAPDGKSVAGYVGVEIPVSVFAGNTKADVINTIGLGLSAVIVVFFFILLFVDRFVRRPIARVEAGVARIAGGDYTTPVRATSNDELGRLAGSVNRMREQISGYISHLAASLTQLRMVSEALTTTTSGVDELRGAVVQAARAIAGEESLVLVVTKGEEAFAGLGETASGGGWSTETAAGRVVTSFPMDCQGERVGFLRVATSTDLAEVDALALASLANNAGVALENTRLFEQDKQTVSRLLELDAMKSDFLTTAQHELRTPVFAILGQLDLVRVGWDAWDDTTKLGMLNDIEISTQRMGDLVGGMVDFNLLAADKVTLKKRPAKLDGALNDALAAVQKLYAKDEPPTVTLDIASSLAVQADPTRLTQVFHALLDNSFKFTPAGGRVEVEAKRQGAFCSIALSDNGIGISEEALSKVFDQLFQEDNSKTRAYGGMGMGLALVKRICELHGADIAITSTKGSGTKVSIMWPLATEQPEEVTVDTGFHIAASR